jgi:hypothetical protein
MVNTSLFQFQFLAKVLIQFYLLQMVLLNEALFIIMANCMVLTAKRKNFPAQVMHLCPVITHADFRAYRVMDIRRSATDTTPTISSAAVDISPYVLTTINR